MIHLNTHLSKRNEDVNVDDSFEHTLTRWFIWTHIYQEKWRCKWNRWFEHKSQRNEDVNEVDDSFEPTFIKVKWRCKWCRWFIRTHTYQREMKM